MSSEKNRPQENDWWEQEDKVYNTDRNLKAEYDQEDKTKRMIKERLGVVEEETDDDGVSKIEGEKNNHDKDDGEKIGDNIKRQVGKWWERLLN